MNRILLIKEWEWLEELLTKELAKTDNTERKATLNYVLNHVIPDEITFIQENMED